MKTCLVRADLPVAYKVANFNSRNLQKIKELWEEIKDAITHSINLINHFGIDRDNLTSVNSIIPIIYFKYTFPHIDFMGTSKNSVQNISLIRKWLILSLLNGVFGGSSDNILRDIRGAIKASETEIFPINAVSAAISRSNRKVELDEYTISDISGNYQPLRGTYQATSYIRGPLCPIPDHL